MPQPQSQKQPQLNQLQQQKLDLQQVTEALRDSRHQLAAIQDEIKKNNDQLELQASQFARTLGVEIDKKKAEHAAALTTLEQDLDKAKQDKAVYEAAVNNLKAQIIALNAEQEQIHQTLKFNTYTHEQKVKQLRVEAQELERKITDQRGIHDGYVQKAADARAKLARIEQKVVQTEQGYISRIEILQQQERDAEAATVATLAKLQEYQSALDQVSERDVKRLAELEQREKTLIAQTRAFNEERIDFAAQKRRFEQTKQLR